MTWAADGGGLSVLSCQRGKEASTATERRILRLCGQSDIAAEVLLSSSVLVPMLPRSVLESVAGC